MAITQAYQEMKEAIETSLQAVVAEYVEWEDTGVLRDGKIREIAAQYQSRSESTIVDSTQALSIARACLYHVAIGTLAEQFGIKK